MKTRICIVLMMVIPIAGCRSIRPDYSFFKSEHEEEIDELWRQGAGYNNPNSDRIKNGQTPLNFDGKPDTFESAVDDFGDRAIGNAVAFVIFEGIPALARGISNKLRR